MPKELNVITKPATAHTRRVRYWREMHGDIPEGKTVDVTCGDKLCIDRGHIYLRDKRQNGGKYGPYRDMLENMRPDEWFDIPSPPRGAKELIKFRCGLNAICGKVKFALRSWPSGRVQIIRIGTRASLWDGEEGYTSTTVWTTRQRKAQWHRPAQLFLGFMRNYGEQFRRLSKCLVRGCVFPAIETMCSYHGKWMAMPESMTDSAIDISDFYNPREPDAPFYLDKQYPVKIDNLEKSLTFERNGYRDDRHKNLGVDYEEYEDEPDRALLVANAKLEEWTEFFNEPHLPDAVDATDQRQNEVG